MIPTAIGYLRFSLNGPSIYRQIASWIDEGVDAVRREDGATIARIAEEVRALALGFPIPGWRFSLGS
jgi:hypothetical protein